MTAVSPQARRVAAEHAHHEEVRAQRELALAKSLRRNLIQEKMKQTEAERVSALNERFNRQQQNMALAASRRQRESAVREEQRKLRHADKVEAVERTVRAQAFEAEQMRQKFAEEDAALRESQQYKKQLLATHRKEAADTTYQMQKLMSTLESARLTGPDDPKLAALLQMSGSIISGGRRGGSIIAGGVGGEGGKALAFSPRPPDTARPATARPARNRKPSGELDLDAAVPSGAASDAGGAKPTGESMRAEPPRSESVPTARPETAPAAPSGVSTPTLA